MRAPHGLSILDNCLTCPVREDRETVSRLFSEFKKNQLLQVKGSTLLLRNRAALEKMVH
jgi:hypothetical protein